MTLSKGAMALMAFLAITGAAQATHFKIFIMAGQSNMEGIVPTSEYPAELRKPQPRVFLFAANRFGSYKFRHQWRALQPGGGRETGCELSLGRDILKADPDQKYIFIKHAEGGSTLYNEWQKGRGSRKRFHQTVDKALARLKKDGNTYEIVAMLWTQGEHDAIHKKGADYEANLTRFISEIRARYNKDLPFFVTSLSKSTQKLPADQVDLITAAQKKVAEEDPLVTFIDMEGMKTRDGVHFSAESQIAMGERYAAAYLKMKAEQEEAEKKESSDEPVDDSKK